MHEWEKWTRKKKTGRLHLIPLGASHHFFRPLLYLAYLFWFSLPQGQTQITIIPLCCLVCGGIHQQIHQKSVFMLERYVWLQNFPVRVLCIRNKHDKFNLPGGSSQRSKRNFPYLSLGVRLSLEFRVLFFPLLCVFSMPIPHLVRPPGYFLPFFHQLQKKKKM